MEKNWFCSPKKRTYNWMFRELPNLIKHYEPKNAFNIYELGLFYRFVPSKSYSIKGQKCSGGKKSKERVTILLKENMDGSEKLI